MPDSTTNKTRNDHSDLLPIKNVISAAQNVIKITLEVRAEVRRAYVRNWREIPGIGYLLRNKPDEWVWGHLVSNDAKIVIGLMNMENMIKANILVETCKNLALYDIQEVSVTPEVFAIIAPYYHAGKMH